MAKECAHFKEVIFYGWHNGYAHYGRIRHPYICIHTLSSVRAYVGAEGLWSKAQKDAAYSLQKYGRSHDEQDYKDYQGFLKYL